MLGSFWCAFKANQHFGAFCQGMLGLSLFANEWVFHEGSRFRNREKGSHPAVRNRGVGNSTGFYLLTTPRQTEMHFAFRAFREIKHPGFKLFFRGRPKLPNPTRPVAPRPPLHTRSREEGRRLLAEAGCTSWKLRHQSDGEEFNFARTFCQLMGVPLNH